MNEHATRSDEVLIETDSRGRTNLSKFSRNGRFLAHQESDGAIILQPCRIVKREAEEQQ